MSENVQAGRSTSLWMPIPDLPGKPVEDDRPAEVKSHFNSFERCWDCPCHGSHFDIDGHELNAPATAPLAPIEK
jgi:Rieske Fe-S protein